MAEIIKIAMKPTFDIRDFSLQFLDSENKLAFFESKQVFKFDRVYGFLTTRSRVTRIDRKESSLVEQIISATIDAGYQGHLVWKIKLTNEGVKVMDEYVNGHNQELLDLFCDCQQIHLFPSPGDDYYNGTHQTDLEPEIIFSDK
jgi:hypothetical protein